MQQKVFDPGRTLTWNELTSFATGSDLRPRRSPRISKESDESPIVGTSCPACPSFARRQAGSLSLRKMAFR